MAFRYPLGIPEVNTAALNAVDPTGNDNQKARNLFDLLKLDPRISQKPDRRVKKRNEVFQTATESLADWKINQTPAMQRQIIRTAVANGFFSVWMTVFEDEPDILREMINAFPATETAFFDDEGRPVMLNQKPALAATP